MTWHTFERAAPDMAAFGREQFEQQRMALIGTIRRDGSPRISCVEPCILDGNLYLGMLRDPRILIRNAICSNTGNEAELSLRGRAIDVHDHEIRRQYVEAMAERTPWKEPLFHLFVVELESAALVRYGAGEQSVSLWPQGREFKRAYESRQGYDEEKREREQ